MSATSTTEMPASRKARAVPPVETISTDNFCRIDASSISPVLSETLIKARRICTNPLLSVGSFELVTDSLLPRPACHPPCEA